MKESGANMLPLQDTHTVAAQAMERPRHIRCRVNRRFLPVKSYYFLSHAAFASLNPYLVVYLKQEGLSTGESGVLFGTMPFLSFFVQPLVGAAADRWLKHKAVLVIATLLTGLFHLLFLAVPPRTPAGRVLTSDAQLTCFNDKVPLLSVCGSKEDGSWLQNDCLSDELRNVSSNSSSMARCISANNTERKTNNEGKIPCWSNIPDLLDAFTKDSASSKSHQCTVGCDSRESNESHSVHEVRFMTNQDVATKGVFVNASLEYFPVEFRYLQNCIGVVTSDQKINVGNARCQTYCLTSFLSLNGSLQKLICDNNMTLRCKIRCQKKTDDPVCEHSSNTFDLTFGLLYAVYLAAFLTSVPTSSMMDAMTYAILKDERHQYGLHRVWGTIGYLLAAVCASVGMRLITQSGGKVDYDMAFYAYSTLCGFSALAAFLVKPPREVRCGNMLKNAWSLLTLPRVAVFLLVMFYFGAAFSGSNFMFWFLADLNASPEIFALCTVFAVLPEVPVMLVSGRLLTRFGPVPCMCVAVVTISVRVLAYSLLRNPWLVLLVEPLDGITYGLMLPAATAYASLISPPGMSGTTQGLVAGMLNGLGRGAGGLLTGWLFGAVGARMTYRVYAGCGVVVFVVYTLLHRLVFTGKAPQHRAATTITEMKDINETVVAETRQPLVIDSDIQVQLDGQQKNVPIRERDVEKDATD